MPVRRTPRALAALTAAVLGSTGLALATGPTASAADSTPGYSKTPILVDVKIGPANDQTCRISADLYRPDTATKAHPRAAILTTHGFGGTKDDSNQLAIAKGFVNQGYVVLSYSGLGFGSTTCKINLDRPAYDGKAGKQMVDVLAGTRSYLPEAGGAAKKVDFVKQESKGDPRVGMIGGSYGGQIQYAVASQDPRVDAIIPIITWNDLSYSLAPNNTDTSSGVTYRTPGVAKKEWVDLFFGDGIISGAQGASVDPTRNVGCPNFVTDACTAVAQLNTAGYPDAGTLALARSASVSSYVKRIKVPTLLVQGEKDTLFNLQESIATFRSLRAQGTPTRMVWQSWGHSGSTPAPGELDFGAASIRDSLLGRRFLNWMNHYVRGQSDAPVGPRFSYFRDWVKYDTSPKHAGTAVAAAYRNLSSFSGAPTATLYFSGTDTLVKQRSGIAGGSASYANAGPAPTSYSETSGLEGSQVNNPPSDGPGTFVAFTSRPLRHATDLVGAPRLTVRLSAPVAAATQAGGPAGQLVLFAKIYDVAPDGTKTLHQRLVSPVRVGDVTKPVQITLPAVVQRFAAGHRIQVVLAASDSAYAGNAAAQPVTVNVSKATPSSLQLPLVQALEFR
jgi:predicted acyl esterase